MTINPQTALAALAMLFYGVMAGFFFAWTNPAMMGFAQTSPAAYVEAMQQINAAVRNWRFGLFFFGALPLGIVAALAFAGTMRALLLAAAGAYAAALLVTIARNAPMNEAMALWRLDALPTPAEIARYLDRWRFWNDLRTLASLAACALAGLALAHRAGGAS